ncbi:MAG TPA: LLM class F420-dependent oxidoreductase [Acidimicrobiaceae bacterium]|nr:LLM class F420-dependent oxidoreductase [Acidimicrobiaceae bacterium]HCV34933.1 LLM class F420-dependent oxidoreductase [Acidimicrobiaceae bacterium]
MKVGIAFANTGPFGTAEGAALCGRSAEAAGFDSLWTVEHVVYPDGYGSTYPYDDSGRMLMAPDTDLTDPLTWLTWVGAHTSTIRLATGILILPERNPVVLAKQLGTMDTLTGGRVDLGIGVGWLREEFDALGIPWERRGARTDEYVAAMRTLWSGDSVDFDGDFVSFSGVSSNPKPTSGAVPIVVGGHTDAAARRAGRLGDGFWPGKGDLDHLLDVMRREAESHDRDPDAIEVTWAGDLTAGDDPLATAAELASRGVDRLIVPSFVFWQDTEQRMATFGDDVVAQLADL